MEPHPFIPQRQLPASSFQTGLKLGSLSPNYTPPSWSPNPSWILTPRLLSTSTLSLSELGSSRLEYLIFDSSELDSDWSSSSLSQKSSSSLCFLRNLFFVPFSDRFFYVCDFQRRERISDLGAACASCLAPLSHNNYLVYNA